MRPISLEGDKYELTLEAINKLVEFEKSIKAAKAAEDEFKKTLLKEMEEAGVIKLDNEQLSIIYVAETVRESLDTKALREELPDVYDAYVRMSKVKPSLRIRLKE